MSAIKLRWLDSDGIVCAKRNKVIPEKSKTRGNHY